MCQYNQVKVGGHIICSYFQMAHGLINSYTHIQTKVCLTKLLCSELVYELTEEQKAVFGVFESR